MIVTEYEVGPGAYGVTLGADGAAWTSLTGRGELARVGPDGQVSHVSLDSAQSRPMVLARGPDDAIWFSRGDGQIGRADPAGTVSAMPVPAARPLEPAARGRGHPGRGLLGYPVGRQLRRPARPARQHNPGDRLRARGRAPRDRARPRPFGMDRAGNGHPHPPDGIWLRLGQGFAAARVMASSAN